MRTFYAILAGFVVVLSCVAQLSPLQIPGAVLQEPPAAGGSCSTETLIWDSTSTGDISTEVDQYLGMRFTATNAITVCKVVIQALKHGTPTGNLKIGFYTHNSGSNVPDTLIDWSDTVAASTLPATEGDFAFDSGLSASLSASTIYWCVLHDSAGGMFDANGCKWKYQSGPTVKSGSSADAASWSEASPDNPFKFSIFE